MDLETLTQHLPVGAVLPELSAALKDHGCAVLQAQPGAGKTTLVPLWLAKDVPTGKILMLEPRRLATRGAAERLAFHLGEKPGASVGYRMRGDVKAGAQTRIEVVTEGILTRMIQSDPELNGISVLIFDEFHERSLATDLGLALAIEIRAALRPDLKILVMSATLDAAPVAALLGDAPVITSEGRSFPVTNRFAEKPWRRANQRFRAFETAVAETIETALAEQTGGVLVFLPGAGEIHKVADLLAGRLPKDVHLHKLFGQMDFKSQRAAISPEVSGRKLVLSTSIAETSLTIEDIRVVVDGGLARRSMFDPASGMSRLMTERVTQAEAKQRAGRAGRVAEGWCYKVWTKGEDGALAAFPKPEIQATDLSSLLLECALWGAAGPAELPFLDPPPDSLLAEAAALLKLLGALDAKGHITPHGREIAALPLHPRLAHMVAKGGPSAPRIAALLSEPDILMLPQQRPGASLSLRLEALKDPRKFEADTGYQIHRDRLTRVKAEANRLRHAKPTPLGPGPTAALAYPDRIGKRRLGDAPRFLLSGGKGAAIDPGDELASAPYLVALDLDGDPSEARIRLAIQITEADVRQVFATDIQQEKTCFWSARDARVQAIEREVFGALELSVKPWKAAPEGQIASALLDGIRALGLTSLNFTEKATALRQRVIWCSENGAAVPDMSDAGLLETLETWLLPHLGRQTTPAAISGAILSHALSAMLDWETKEQINHLAPPEFVAPTGTRLKIDYSGAAPLVRVRLQEMFGLTRHPTIGVTQTPLLFELLSPAQRPVQTTADLPMFWQNSYADVRRDMRGRYPKHHWPENPAEALPTTRAKPRAQK